MISVEQKFSGGVKSAMKLFAAILLLSGTAAFAEPYVDPLQAETDKIISSAQPLWAEPVIPIPPDPGPPPEFGSTTVFPDFSSHSVAEPPPTYRPTDSGPLFVLPLGGGAYDVVR